MAELRVGTAFDAHRLVPGLPLVLGGVKIPHSHGLEGHSDADIVCHALCDALLGAACLDDIGTMFPSSDERWAGARSLDLLAEAWRRIAGVGWSVVNVDAFVVLQEPKIAPYRDAHARARRRRPALRRGARVGARHRHGRPRLHGPRRGRGLPGRRAADPLRPRCGLQASAPPDITTTPSASMVASAITPSTWIAARLSPP